MHSPNSPAHAPAINPQPRPWRWGHPRVLVEHPDEAAGTAIASAVRYAGYAVTVCSGPKGPGQCPLVVGGGCAAAHDADLVVSCLGYEREGARKILRGLRTRCPKVPLLVEAPPEIDQDLRESLDGCHQLLSPATPKSIVAAVQLVLGEATEEAPSNA